MRLFRFKAVSALFAAFVSLSLPLGAQTKVELRTERSFTPPEVQPHYDELVGPLPEPFVIERLAPVMDELTGTLFNVSDLPGPPTSSIRVGALHLTAAEKSQLLATVPTSSPKLRSSPVRVKAAAESYLTWLGQNDRITTVRSTTSDLKARYQYNALRFEPAPRVSKGGFALDHMAINTLQIAVWTTLRRDYIVDSIGMKRAKLLDPATPKLKQHLLQLGLDRTEATDVAGSFEKNSKVQTGKLTRRTTLLRLFPAEGNPTGHYYSCCIEHSKKGHVWWDARGLARPKREEPDHLAAVTLPIGTQIVVGPIAGAFGKKGGNVQIFVPKVSHFPFDKYKANPGDPTPSDIIVVGDERVLRFRR
jgi:hypothetical protein